ncbi:innexin unc-9-like [Mizuhopecten yessoensis]|uniref:Innexin n=1 Tax=Mizuhopecten yessoensis TaxID=6573 RepID=A0A210QKF8_MIZYE|nr:innexin unc-9-like [Mizuhopecten yessoensis]OWF49230.1 Innexin unc-9 [Mizuhopecten yessoensis]
MGNGLCVETGSSMTVFDWLDHVLGTVGHTIGLKSVYDDDFIDRLSHYYTVIILIIFTVIVSTNQYVGDPIECWCPADFTENRVEYTNFVCWVSNTYYIPMQHQIPVELEGRRQKELTYYQWIPMILLTMALLFKLPRMVFKVFSAASGISLDRLCTLAKETQYANPEDREKKLSYIVKYLDQWMEGVTQFRAGMCVRFRQRVGQVCCFLCGRHYGNYLVTAVMAVKLLYLGNAVGQLFLLNAFLGTSYNVYGFEVLTNLVSGDDWTYSPRFPRVTLCDFEIRQMTNLQRWTVQCVLPINLFNEKIFIFMWFWIVLVAALSAFSFVINIYAVIFPQHRRSYLRKYLRLNDMYKKSELDKKVVRKFVESYLQQDGVFVLRAVSNNANDVIASELIKLLYINFKEKIAKQRNSVEEHSNV